MSELPLDYRTQLDLRAEIARIDRDRAEAEKFAAEQRKLISESRKLDRDRWLRGMRRLRDKTGEGQRRG